MKKEIFDRIIEAVKPLYLNRHTNEENFKVIENDEFISYCFDDTSPERKAMVEFAKNYFKENGWKHPMDSDIYLEAKKHSSRLVKFVLSIRYNKVKDRISIAEFEHGYAYAHKKGRFYPVRTNHPIFCYSKQLYTFINNRRYKGVRIMKGGYLPHKYSEVILKAALNINYRPSLDQVLTRNFINTKNEVEVLEKMYNLKVPKLLADSFSTGSLDLLCKVLENPGEMNRICQFIITKEKKEEEKRAEMGVGTISFLDKLGGPLARKQNLSYIVSEMCFNDTSKSWLVEDWMKDHYELDEKLSLKITSEKRMRDEHNKLSRARILKGVKYVKMDKLYKDLFKDFAIPVEEVDNKKRLLQESIEQEHCVATYANQINRGDCGIFSMVFKGIRYTLEVNKMLQMRQLQGFRNGREGHNPPQELRDMITDHLASYKIALGDKAPKEEHEFLPF